MVHSGLAGRAGLASKRALDKVRRRSARVQSIGPGRILHAVSISAWACGSCTMDNRQVSFSISDACTAGSRFGLVVSDLLRCSQTDRACQVGGVPRVKAHPFCAAGENVRDDAKYGGVFGLLWGSLSCLPCTSARFNFVGLTVQC